MLKKPFIFMLFCLLWGAAQANPQDNLYEVTVPVANNSEEARSGALREGLGQVIDRLSGTSGSVSDPQLAPLFRGPTRFIDQFRYETTPEGLQIWVRFDKGTLDDAVREQGRSVWRSPRPLTLVWLVIQGAEGTRLVGASDAEAALVTTAAQGRGVMARLPLLDLAELGRIRADELWNGGDPVLRELSRRYEAGTVLVARVESAAADAWRGHFALVLGAQSLNWEGSAGSLAELMDGAMGQVANDLAQQFVPASVQSNGGYGVTGDLRLKISDVLGLGDFRRVRDYLRGLPGVARVQTLAVEPNAMELNLSLTADTQSVLGLIAAGGTLARMQSAAAPVGGEAPAVVEFRLLP